MKASSILRLSAPFLGIAFFAIPADTALAQSAAPQAVSAAGALAQLYAAFSGGHAVNGVQLSGAATWYAGSLEDSGTVSLTAATGGSSQMQLNLATTGQITESQTGVGSTSNCSWAGTDGVAHSVDLGNCWRPTLWFLPALSVQPSALTSETVFADLGSGTVGSVAGVYHHLQGQIMRVGATSKPVSDLMNRSTIDMGLDSASSLPAVLAYTVHPNNGAPVSIAIEVHYSDYRAVNGAQIPFHIQRYVNGSLQLDIRVSSALIN